MYYFFDTSAFVKYYADEEGSREVRGLMARAFREPSDIYVIVCDLVVPEAVSALVRKATNGEDSSLIGRLNGLMKKVVDDVLSRDSPFIVVESSGVVHDAPSIIRQHRLTGADAVQLAAAIAARAHTPYGVEFVFACTDRRLEEAARREGFTIMEEILPAPAGR